MGQELNQFQNLESAAIMSNAELLKTTAEASVTSKLWDAAYEHKGEIAAAVGTMAATAAIAGTAALLTKGRYWGKPNVLLIEDTVGMGMAYKEALTASGHKVTWVTKVNSLSPLTGITHEGKEIALSSRRTRLAFLDGDLGKGNLEGAQIAGTLKDNRFMTITTSTQPTMNAEMVQKGATVAARKDVVYVSLLGDKIDLRAALKSPSYAQKTLDEMQSALKTDAMKPLRKKADETLMDFLTRQY